MSRHPRGLAAAAVCAVGAATLLAVPPAAVAAEEPLGIRINEVVSNGGTPDDWIEFYNHSDSEVDLSDHIVQDNSTKNPYTFPAGTIVAPGEYLVLDTLSDSGEGDFDFGLGKGDSVRLFAPGDANGTQPLLQTTWPADTHAVPSWGAQGDGDDVTYVPTAESTKGGENIFPPSDGDGGEGEPGTDSDVVLNEIIYDDISGVENDSIELYNAGAAPMDIGGWSVTDDKNEESGVIPTGTTLEPGAFLMLEKDVDFPFGLGKGDAVVLSDASDTVIDSYAYENTAPIAVWARCPDGTGDWAHGTEATPGAANNCAVAPVPGSVVLNEVDSGPADWVELYNPGTETFDISDYELRDNSDDHRWAFPADTMLAAGEFLLVEAESIGIVDGEPARFDSPIGIGSTDEMRLFDPSGALIDRTGAWEGHANIDGDEIAATLARCIDGVGAFALAYATPGATNNCVPPTIAINEINSSGAPDWAEIVNTGTEPIDISGWTLMDNDPFGHAADVVPLAEGTILEPGEYFVFNGTDHFTFGLGGGDTVTIRNGDGLTVAEHTYDAHADGFWARCEDGTGDFVDVAVGTPGIRNACGNPIRINEVESDGDPDWIELVNPTGDALDISGIVVKDDDDTHEYVIAEGTSIPANGYLVIDDLDFGIGKDDTVRLFDGDQLIDSTSWGTSHAATTWGRCPDVTGPFASTAEATKGAANICIGEIPVSPWPGSSEARVLDVLPMFLEDGSGLDVQSNADGTFLWAVDNGEGRIWKLAASADGSVSLVDGWADGKRVRFQKDASNPDAAGPDTEGITVDDSGLVYLASERDNSDKGVNQNKILQVDPNSSDSDLIALTEWDLTALLPAVGANLGIEAVEWVPDAALTGKLVDDNAQAAYDPSAYAGKSDGLFFVAVEDGGGVYAFALSADGSAELVSTIDPGLAGAMALDYDSVLGVLWAVCDDGCGGKSAQITLNGTDTPGIAHFARAAGLPDINNEGFATAPASLVVDGQRPVWWFADGYATEALRTGTLPAAGSGDGGSGDDGEPGEPGGTPPLPGDALDDDNRGDATVNPSVAAPGDRVTITVGAEHAGRDAVVWMYSEPVRIGAGSLDTAGAMTVTIPTDAVAGAHRIAVYSSSGELLGWANIEITGGGGGLAATGSELPAGAAMLMLGLLFAGAVAVTLRRRRQAGYDSRH